MSARHELNHRLVSLGEIQEIVGSMKTLAAMETHRLERIGDNQHRVVEGIRRAALEVCRAWPELLEAALPAGEDLCLLLGSERGFCGDFNEGLLERLSELDRDGTRRQLLVVGSRLADRLEHDLRVSSRLPGATGADEVPAVLSRVVDTVLALLPTLRAPQGLPRVMVLSHQPGEHEVRVRPLLPPFGEASGPAAAGQPRVHLSPDRLLAQLTEQYLFAGLLELFYQSLLAENQRRVQHLEAAGRRLEEERERLRRRANTLRQQAITEEIEVILLGAGEAAP